MSVYGHERDHRDDGCHIAVAAVVASLAGVMWPVGVLVRRHDRCQRRA